MFEKRVRGACVAVADGMLSVFRHEPALRLMHIYWALVCKEFPVVDYYFYIYRVGL